MDSLLIRLMVLAALAQLGISTATFRDCTHGRCLARIEKASRDFLRVDWKPISVFPEEARKFRHAPGQASSRMGATHHEQVNERSD